MRVWSLRRLPGSNCAKAMRDMRSPPKTACGLRLETEASCSPELELHQRRHHARGADVDGEAELEERGVARLDGEDAAAEARDGDLALAVAEGGGQGLEHVGGHVVDGARRRRPAAPRGPRSGGAPPWEARPARPACRCPASIVTGGSARRAAARRRGSESCARRAAGATWTVTGRGHRALAGRGDSPRGPAPSPSWSSSMMVGGGDGARDELDPARRAATAPAAGRRDVDAGGVRRLQDGRAGLDVEGAAIGKNGQDRAHSGLRIPLPA